MRARARARLLVAAMAVGAVGLGPGLAPAGADYAPWVVATPTAGPPGTVITATNNDIGWCATTAQEPGQDIQPGVPGSVVVELGTLAQNPDIGGFVELDRVLVHQTIAASADGSWTAHLTVPVGTPAGRGYAVAAHCFLDSTTSTTEAATTELPPPSTSSSLAPGPAAKHLRAPVLAFDYYPARFEVTAGPGAPADQPEPADPVSGGATYTG